MAERRMFAKTIIDSDAFLDMPLSAQALYFHLSMRADDDGFVNNPKRIQRTIGGSDDDYRILLAKNFIISFDSGVIVIKHWKIHNYIRGDRKKDTAYPDEMGMLTTKENGAYTLCLSDDSQMSGKRQTNVSIGKDSIGKESIDKDSIGNSSCGEVAEPPTPQEPVFIKIPLVDKTEFDVTENMVKEFSEAYPAVDVEQQLRSIRQWCIANPQKRKTRRGALKFINGWLGRDQDRGGSKQQKVTQQSSLEDWAARKDGNR